MTTSGRFGRHSRDIAEIRSLAHVILARLDHDEPDLELVSRYAGELNRQARRVLKFAKAHPSGTEAAE